MSFETPIYLCGPPRKPLQMLVDQKYSGHASIHDDAVAEKLGFRAGPIEGPTHFSQFTPLCAYLWGQSWFEQGFISAHYQNMVVEGEEVRAFVALPHNGATSTTAWAAKVDGTPVLEASVSIGPTAGGTLLEQRMKTLRPAGRLVILADLAVGMRGSADEPVRMDMDQHMGALYPCKQRSKLQPALAGRHGPVAGTVARSGTEVGGGTAPGTGERRTGVGDHRHRGELPCHQSRARPGAPGRALTPREKHAPTDRFVIVDSKRLDRAKPRSDPAVGRARTAWPVADTENIS